LLQNALGFSTPNYAHLPLILGPDKSKLSKRHGAVSLSDYRSDGYLPEALFNYLANLGYTPAKEIQSLEELIDKALEQHPAIKVASYNVQSALSDSRRARNSNYPRLDLRLAKEVGNDLNGFTGDTDDLSLVLNLSYNLYRGGADQAEARKKISVVHQNQEFSAQVRRQVINTLRLAWMADQSLSSQLRYLKIHIEKALETVTSYGEEFFIGQRDLVDLLDAEGELNTAKNQYTVAFYDEMVARFRVLEAMGMLFPALSLNVAVGDDDLQISKVISPGTTISPHELDKGLELYKVTCPIGVIGVR